ncbi:MAG: hypothetical protein ABIO70_04605 [Pseudomonadota bacterium]
MTTPSPASRPRLPQRLRTALKWLPWLLLLALLADHAWLMLEWASRDFGFALPVFSGAAHSVSEALERAATDGWWRVLTSHEPTPFAWPAVAMLRLTGPDLRFLNWTNTVLMLVSMALIFDAGRLLEGAWAGLVAAAALPLLPDIALVEHRWSAGMVQLPLLLGAFDLLIRSRGLSRPLPSLGVALVGWVLLQAAGMETENICALAPFAAMVAAALTRSLLTGRGPVGGQRVGRILPLLFGLGVAAAATHAMLRSGHLDEALAYVRQESSGAAYPDLAPRWSWAALTAYARFWASTSLSPWFAAPLLVALPVWARRGAGRAELFAWLLLPLAAFSLIAKKNPYYINLCLPAAALLLGLGLTSVRRWGLGIALVAVTLTLGELQWLSRSFTEAGRWRQIAAYRQIPDAEWVFQTPVRPVIHPTRVFRHGREWRMLRDRVHDSPCRGLDGPRIGVLGIGDHEDLRLALAMTDPCVGAIATWPELREHEYPRWTMVTDPSCGPGAAADDPPASPPEWWPEVQELERRPWIKVVAVDRSASPCLTLYDSRREPSWSPR